MKWIIHIITVLSAIMFLFFAALQYNDPDPYLWIPVYLIFAVLAVSVARKPLPNYIYWICSFSAIVFAWFQKPEHWEGIGESMYNENTERAREAIGLLICAGFAMLFIWFNYILKNRKAAGK